MKTYKDIKYNDISRFYEDRAWIKVGVYYGFIDIEGHCITPIIYMDVTKYKDQKAKIWWTGIYWNTIDLYGFIVSYI